jgi:hypothetical protein
LDIVCDFDVELEVVLEQEEALIQAAFFLYRTFQAFGVQLVAEFGDSGISLSFEEVYVVNVFLFARVATAAADPLVQVVQELVFVQAFEELVVFA